MSAMAPSCARLGLPTGAQMVYKAIVERHEDVGNHVEYCVLVSHRSGLSWRVWRRFSAFDQLHGNLYADVKEVQAARLPKPPQKSWLPSFTQGLASEFLQERHEELQTYLNELLAQPVLARHKAVQELLGVEPPEAPAGVRVVKRNENHELELEIKPGMGGEASPVDGYDVEILHVALGQRYPFKHDVGHSGQQPQKARIGRLPTGEHCFTVVAVNFVGRSAPVSVTIDTALLPARDSEETHSAATTAQENAHSTNTAALRRSSWSGTSASEAEHLRDTVHRAPIPTSGSAPVAVDSIHRAIPQVTQAVPAVPLNPRSGFSYTDVTGQSGYRLQASNVVATAAARNSSLQRQPSQPVGSNRIFQRQSPPLLPASTSPLPPFAASAAAHAAAAASAAGMNPSSAPHVQRVSANDHIQRQPTGPAYRPQVGQLHATVVPAVQPPPPRSSSSHDLAGALSAAAAAAAAAAASMQRATSPAAEREAPSDPFVTARVPRGRYGNASSQHLPPGPKACASRRPLGADCRVPVHIQTINALADRGRHCTAADETPQVGIQSAAPASAGDRPSIDEEEQVCVICLAQPKTHAFVPCGHRCVCQGCGEEMMNSEHAACPICRAKVTQMLKIFT